MRNPLTTVASAILIVCLVGIGHYYGLQRQNENREELRPVIMFDVETVEKTLNGQRVQIKMGSFSIGIDVFQMPVTDAMLQDYWKGYVAGSPPPQVRMELYLSQIEMRGMQEENWYDLSSLDNEYLSFLFAFAIFAYIFVAPAFRVRSEDDEYYL